MTLHFLLTSLVVVLIPGTGVIYTLAIALGQGQRASAFAALGCTLGIIPHLLAAILGLAALLHMSAVLFNIVKFAGVAYLLWLAWQAVSSGGAVTIQADARRHAYNRIAVRGALINILNPKLSIFFLALLPPFLSGNLATATTEMLGLGGVFMGLTLGVFLLYGAFAATLRQRILASRAAMSWLNRSFAAVFATLGLRLAFEKA